MKNVIRSIILVVGIPVLIAGIYYGLFASDLYVSESKFSIRSSKPGVSLSGVAALFGGSDSTGSGQDSIVIKDYIHSQDMLENLDQKLNLFDQYTNQKVDVISRLEVTSTREEFLEYMKDKIEVTRDDASNIISLQVKAFTADLAKAISLEIIRLSESLVNRMSTRIESDTLEIAQVEVERAAQKVRDVSKKLSDLRHETSSIDPSAETNSVLGIVSGIESRLTEARTQLAEKRAFMRDSSPEVRSLQNRVSALNEQLALERDRLAGGQGGSMNGLIQQYQPLILEQELAREQYTSALGSLEAARLEAHRKKQYLITFVSPNLPDKAIEPRRIMNVLTVALFSFLFYTVAGLMWSALKDHIGR